MKSNLLVEQHFHGCFGIDFNKACEDDILYLSHEIIKEGIGFIFPTLVTDSVENIKKQISIIKTASEKQTKDMAKICGIHLEGIFLNPQKKGIHNEDYFLLPTLENYKLVDDNFIKIITLAPELASQDLLSYLKNNAVKIQAGHCLGTNLSSCNGTTHTFNAMGAITHKESSTALSALITDDIYSEIIADGVHVCDDALKLFFKSKPSDKVILVSDCLPCTRSELKEFVFADHKVFYNGVKATSKEGTLAGSTVLLPNIVKILASKSLFKKEYILNPYKYHSIPPKGEIEWDENYNIVKITY